ncbi:hypothetical protein C8Q76DRAFT_396662 [Earliella scabrosa]|nr:hypothetical protein C8Q76DRAFT_396662 [Earliella scabrosa]
MTLADSMMPDITIADSVLPSTPPSQLSASLNFPNSHADRVHNSVILMPVPSERENYSRCLATYIAPEDKDAFLEVKALTRKMLPRFLGVTLRWTEHDPDRKQQLFSTILAAYPAFEKYENIWPIRLYCHQHYGELRRHRRRRVFEKTVSRQKTCHGTNVCGVASQSGSRGSSVTAVPCVSTLDANEHETQSDGSVHRDPSVPADPIVDCNSTQGDCPTRCNPTRNLNSDGRGSPCPRQAVDPAKEMLQFLRSVDPSFECLLDRFVSAGLKDMSRLRVVAGWDVDKKNRLLRQEVRLDPFECQLVCDALRARFPATD